MKLYEGDLHEIINTYTKAVQTVQLHLAVGKLHTLCQIVSQIADVGVIFKRARHAPYTKVDDLASVWCEWAEMEIRQGNCKEALKRMYRATVYYALYANINISV